MRPKYSIYKPHIALQDQQKEIEKLEAFLLDRLLHYCPWEWKSLKLKPVQ